MRKARLERKLSQPQVAKILNVVADTVTLWELNRNEPTEKYASKIIKFIGYFPFEWEHENLQTQVNYARMVSGQTLRQMGKEIGVDSSTMYKIFSDKSEPKGETLVKIRSYIIMNLK
ncbi:MAG: helix-turn-helix transcriptional regulator [Chitinophagales bacterium]|nr:helix-turn-helix transcriptional regulator [Chitinophagales bacterium]